MMFSYFKIRIAYFANFDFGDWIAKILMEPLTPILSYSKFHNFSNMTLKLYYVNDI